MSATRVYLGRLPPMVREDDIVDHFKNFKVRDIALRGNFGFIEFDSPMASDSCALVDAEDAIREYDGRDFMGERIIVQPSRESRRQRDDYDRPPMSRGPPRRGVRLHVIGIPDRTSWQDLKDFGRQASQGIMYADVDRNDPSIGIIEFPNQAEAEDAITQLTGREIRNTPVRLELAPEGGGGGGGYGGGGGGGGGYGGGYGGGGGGGGYPPRDYPPRDYDRRPPPPSRDYEDRRGGHGGGDSYAPRRDEGRDEPRRDDYRRDDRPPRRDYDRDRSPPRRAERDRYDDREDRAPAADVDGRAHY